MKVSNPIIVYLIEVLGTFLLLLLVFFSKGNAFVIGIGITILILLFSKLSGAHFNPAVTISKYFIGQHDKKDTIFYLIAQFSAAILLFALWKRFIYY
tara:strand:- start:2619 stop:2909 length:291 start_codon:yes stop_codon:yes gene_type:complete